jgi:hypothetical protein
MSTSRIDSNVPPVPVQGPKPSQAPASTPFGQVLSGSNAVVGGAQSNSGLAGAPAFAAATREVGAQVVGNVVGGVVGGVLGGGPGSAASAATATGSPVADFAQVTQMQKESQAFSLQLLNLQQDVQDENRRFTTVSNVLKTAHDTAKGAVGNLRS